MAVYWKSRENQVGIKHNPTLKLLILHVPRTPRAKFGTRDRSKQTNQIEIKNVPLLSLPRI